jgi:hypothetical protein
LFGRWAIRFSAVGLILELGMGLAQAAPPADSQLSLTATQDGINVEWRTPEAIFTREPAPSPIGGFSDGAQAGLGRGFIVALPGYAQLTQPGLPRLPVASALVALPPGANPSLEMLAIEETELPLPGPLALAPRPAGVERNALGEVIGGAYEPVSEMKPFNPAVVELESVGEVRGVRLARLVFYPLRPAGDQLRFTRHVSLFLHYNAPVQKSQAPADDLLSTLVINPEAIQPAPTRLNPQPLSPNLASITPRAAIEVSHAGLTTITYSALNALGFPVGSTNPANVHLTRAGQEIALEWDGDGDTVFEMGERFLFYADPRFSRWTTTDVYFLTVDAIAGLRMSSRSASPTGLVAGNAWMDQLAETNALYTPDCYCAPIPPGRDGDRWTWDVLRRPDRASITYTVNLPTVSVTQPATLTTWFIGYTDVGVAPDHRVKEKLNGISVGQTDWDGKQAITATLTISANVLVNGNNSLNLSLPGLPGTNEVEGMWLDAFSIRYARGSAASGASAIFTGDSAQRAYTVGLSSTTGLRAYDVTDSIHPQRLISVTISTNSVTFGDPTSGRPRRYALAAESGIIAPDKLRLASSLTGAKGKYIVIAPSAFIPALTGLVSLRQSQGLTVTVENTQAIYDNYDGRPTPDALRAYLANAYATWNPIPTYVLLVGDGNFDPKQYRGDSTQTFIPPYLAEVDPWAGETAADNRYVTLAGNDALPEMLIGRLPVNSLAEAQTVVDKIVNYETQPFPGGWNANAAFVADNADSGGDFPGDSEALATNYIDPPFVTQPIYYLPPTSTITSTHAAVLSRWNAGAGLMTYTGHSSTHQWALAESEPLAIYPYLFHSDEVASLNNGRQLPVLLEMTCLTGSFQVPNSVTLDEALTRHPNGGAVAVWGATGLGISTGHQFLAAGFLNSIYTPGQTLGQAALAGKINLATNDPADIDLVDTYNLLGDPAMKLDLTLVPWTDSLYLPVIRQ